MCRSFGIISLLMTLSLLDGCSYFFHKDPVLEQAASSNSAPNQIEKKVPLESCEVQCSKSAGLKKKFCLKKCEFKKKRAERNALREWCESKKMAWWLRLIYWNWNKDSSSGECADF